ncbi:hypothetical protein ACELLULO517_14235 [Acidisoma cellulosilytica]|uniref:Gluconate 2-dehydrogenase subunit 3 family protein n=1 Tax=Acidisoma cellulosilyticum TaxID=2802395 RepID=A0A963Z291_9PROT|nr:hypothetical protein [Acidisoma cellulosilyticum]MCB8881404.1 hypothetical protein [Acidisoma cellulosilyticum]
MTDKTETLAVLLDELLPGGEDFPAAQAIDLAGRLLGRPEWAKAAEIVLILLPEGFAALAPALRVGKLRDLEATERQAFDALIVSAYSAYYTHAAVRAVIEAKTGYAAGPPQPAGFTLPAFDPAVLDVVRRRPPSYRRP